MRRFRIAISVLMLAAMLLVGTVPIASASPPAQGGIRTVTHDQTGKLTFIGINTASGGRLPKATGNQPSISVGMNDLAAYSQEFGITDPARELQFMKSATTHSGSTSYRYQQVYQGVPVLAGELIANYDSRGNLAAISGEISPDLSLDVMAQVSTTTAKERALGYVARQGFDLANLTATEPELWIYDARLLQPSHLAPVLVWRLEVKSIDFQPIDYLVLVDAKLGGVRLAFNQIDTYIGQVAAERLGHNSIAPVADPGALAAPNYPDPLGTTWDSHSTDSRNGAGFSTVVCNTPPTALTGAGSCDGTEAPSSTANAAHYFAYDTFNYYDSHHNRNSIDDAGHPLNSNVNFRPGLSPYMNAFWDGQVMTYGDGDFFTADDVVAHELSHGVTEYGSSLLYFYESGAINEAMSDIFGEFVDQANGINSYNTGVDDPADKWLMGEDLGIGAIRDMSNPPAFGDPDRTRSSIYWTSGLDNGGVHINSGVVNKTAYLMAEGGTFNGQTITGLGNDKTSAIFYEVNQTLLTTGADFQQLDAAISQACENILAGANPLGFTTADCTEADEATMATELHLEPVNDNWTPQANLCPNPSDTPTLTLFSNDFESDTGNTLTGFEDDVISGTEDMPGTAAWQEATLSGASNIFPPVTGNRTAFGVNHPYLYGYDPYDSYESYLQMSDYVALPAANDFYLYFDHYFAFEIWQDQFGNVWEPDGGVLEYQIQGSSTWTDAGSLFDAGQDYNGIVDSHDNSSPLEGQSAFIVGSHGYVSTRYDLSSLAGQSVRFRWRIGADSFGDLGWYLDNVQVYTCDAVDVAAFDDSENADLVSVGDTFTYQIGLANFGPNDAQNVVVNNVFSGAASTINQVWASHSDCTSFPCAIDMIRAGLGGNIWVEVTANAPGTIVSDVSIPVDVLDTDPANNAYQKSTVVADAPILIAPADGSRTSNNLPTFEWNADFVPWAASYEIQIDDNDDFSSVEQTVVTTDLFYDAELLFDDTTYYWRVRGLDGSDVPRDWSPVWSVDIDDIRLDPPTLRQPRDRATTADTTPRFSWKGVKGAVNYWLQVSDDEDFEDQNLVVNDQTLVKTKFIVPDDLSYRVYYWRVAAQDASGDWSDWSSIYAFTLTIQTSPKNGDYSVNNPPTFRWKKVAGATRYEFQLEDVPGPIPQPLPLAIESTFEAVIIDDDTLTTTKYTPASALAEGRYNWRVRAEVGGAWTDWMSAWTLTVTSKPPSRPVLTTPANRLVTANDTLSFGWDAVLDAGGPFTYQIQIDNKPNFSSPEQDYLTGEGETTYDADALADGKYYWRVRALNSVGVAGKWSKRFFFTIDTTGPAAPSLVAPASYAATGNQPEFRWKKVRGAATYHLRISENENLNPEVLDVPGITGIVYTPSTPLLDDTYYWAVRSVDALGNEGPWSDTWTFAANSALNPPDTPTLTSPTDGAVVTTKKADLEWTSVVDAAEYQIQVDDKADFKTPVEDEFDPNEARQTQNLDDGKYYWRVRAINADNVAGNWSAPWSFTVDTTGPAAPKLRAPRSGSFAPDRTPTFKWSVPKTAVGYHLQVDDNDDFSSPLLNDNALTVPTYTVAEVDALPYTYLYWQVRAQDAHGNWGPWSSGYFQISLHKSPKIGTVTSRTQPTFKWNSVEGATAYCLQVDQGDFSEPLTMAVNEAGLTVLSYKPVTPLLPGDYNWRVGIDTGSGCDSWMTPWWLHVKDETPKRVKLESPKKRFLTNDDTPTLVWSPVTGATLYDLQIAYDRKFQDTFDYLTLDATLGTSYTIPNAPDDEYFWRVRAINSVNTYGPWSAVWSFTVDTTPPAAPELVGPADETRMTNRKFKLEWSKVSDAARYEIQIDADPSFPIPPIDVGRKTRYKAPSWLSQNAYYWRVRAIDKAGNASDWSDTRIFHLVAGDTAAPLITIEPVEPVAPDDTITIAPNRPVPSDKPADEQPPVNSNDPVPPQEPDTKVPSPADRPPRSTQ
jgi:bacillolysin